MVCSILRSLVSYEERNVAAGGNVDNAAAVLRLTSAGAAGAGAAEALTRILHSVNAFGETFAPSEQAGSSAATVMRICTQNNVTMREALGASGICEGTYYIQNRFCLFKCSCCTFLDS